MSTGFPDRYIARIAIDKDMGPIHTWLGSLRPGARARELLSIMRLGFAVQNGLYIGSAQQLPTTNNLNEGKIDKETETTPTKVTQSEELLQLFGPDMSFFTPDTQSHG